MKKKAKRLKKVVPMPMPSEVHIHNHMPGMPDTNEADKALSKLRYSKAKGSYAQ